MEKEKLQPEKTVRDYLLSKQVKIHKRIWPEIIDADVHLEKCRAKLIRAEEHLQNKRKLYKEKRVEMDKKWKEIADEGQHLRENFITFNSFVMANMEKRHRAESQLEETRRFRMEKERAVEQLEEEIAKVRDYKEELDEAISEHRIYELYLETVVDLGVDDAELKNVDAIVTHFEYFVELAQHLGEEQAKAFDNLQNTKNELSKFIETNTKQVLSLHALIASLRSRFESVKERSHHLEILVSRIKTNSITKYKDIVRTKEAIWNLYAIMCRKRGKKPKFERQDLANQLLFIGRFIKNCVKIRTELEKILKAEEKARLKQARRAKKEQD